MWKGLVSLLFLVAILAMAIGGGGWAWLQSQATAPGPLTEETTFTVAPGDTLVGVASAMQADGLIADGRVMRLRARIDGTEGAIKAGTFAIPAGASTAEILDLLVGGEVIQHRITLPEGRTTAQLLRLIEADPNLTGELPAEPPAEGSLLPDTYLFDAGTERSALIARMSRARDAVLAELWESRADGIPVTSPEEALVLASIVEKETGKAEERGLVAGLFTNRLKRGMRLQSDPTVIYGVSRGEPLVNARGERRTLYRSELDRDTPYNTYTREGLPPTPIANPGADAIRAVLNPPETEYLFFVADGRGGTVFTSNYRDHNRAVQAYRAYEAAEIARERSN